MLLVDRFKLFYETYKEDVVVESTMEKYKTTHQHLMHLAPNLHIERMTRLDYQNIINEFAKTHEKQTVKDFHHQVKSCITEAFEEGLLSKNPALKIVIKGKLPKQKKTKFLNFDQFQKLLETIDTEKGDYRDMIIYLGSFTGARFAEILGLTKESFDFKNNLLKITNNLDYKTDLSLKATKNSSSKRSILINEKTMKIFKKYIRGLDPDIPIFLQKMDVMTVIGRKKPKFVKSKQKETIHNKTINDRLKTLCRLAKVPKISFHGLRHTHASVLLYQGMSLISISKRLGHATLTTTQNIYSHITKELEEKDNLTLSKNLNLLNEKVKHE